MATLNASTSDVSRPSYTLAIYDPSIVSPVIENEAPHSAIRMKELCFLRKLDRLSNYPIEAKPSLVSKFYWCQYGDGGHFIHPRKIIGSARTTAVEKSGRPIYITHFVLEGFWQSVIGRKVTINCDLLHVESREERLLSSNGSWEALPPIGYNNHSHFPLTYFPTITKSLRTLASHTALTSSDDPSCPSENSWPENVQIINKVHKHVFGHASYGDTMTLLQKNKIWNNEVQRYLAGLIERCQDCKEAFPQKPA